MTFKTSPLNAGPSNSGLLRYRFAAFRPALQASARKVASTICSSNLDPWKTLGVSYDADEKQIKRAYRKLALDNHPDLRGSEAAARFVKIQEAYEVVTGKRRGTTAEPAQQSSTAAGGWDFHDWYWKFTAGKRWDQQRKKAPHNPAAEAARPRPTGAPEEALRAQLAGLRRKAAFRARNRAPPAAHQPGHAAGPMSTAFESSSKKAEDTFAGHDFAESQLAGLKRRAKNRHQQQHQHTAATPSYHEAQSQAVHQTVHPAATGAAQTSGTGKGFAQEFAAAAAAMTEVQAATYTSGTEAVASVGKAEGEPAWRGQLRCAREFIADVQQRSTSSNIVAATFTGLRAHLAPTIAELAHHAAAAAGPGSGRLSSAHGASQTRGNSRGDSVEPTVSRVTPWAEAARGPGFENDGQKQCASGGGTSAADKEVCVGQQLASQLAGLKRRAAIRQYPA